MKRFPPSKQAPDATASAYLESRGLNPKGITFKQSSIRVAQEEFSTVAFEVAPGILNHRLIDYGGKDKSRNIGSYKGKVCKTYETLDPQKPLWITEGFIDALSLQSTGKQAVATLSAAHTPDEFLRELPKELKTVILAFDSDFAGSQAIRRHQKWLAEHRADLSVVVCLPPERIDWNDLLLQKKLDEEEFKTGFWRGKLFNAASIQEYHEIWCDLKGNHSRILAWKRQTYWCSATKGKNEDEVELKQKRLLNVELRLMYDLVDSSLEYQHYARHRFRLLHAKRLDATLELTPEDFSNVGILRSRLMSYRAVFFGQTQDLPLLAEYYFNQIPAPPRIRQLQTVGYDPESGAVVLPQRAYAPDGELHKIGSQGYYEKLKVSPFLEKHAIPKLSEIPILPMLDQVDAAFGNRGLLALGYWTAAIFSHTIFEKFGFFPFLSMHGAPRTGKSFLTHFLQKCFGTDWEGLSMSKANTKKGELRILTQFSSLVIPMLEAKTEGYRFDFESILELYNRNSLQIRANTSQDNSTSELQMRCCLAFIQNTEQFASRAAKERVVSLKFNEEDVTDTTYAHWSKLTAYSPEQLANLGHRLWQARHSIEKEIAQEVRELSDMLSAHGVAARRIADNHAIVLAGVLALCNTCGFKNGPELENLFDFTATIALSKIESARSESPLADTFLAALDDLPDPKIIPAEGLSVKRSDGLLYVRMDRALKEIEWRHNLKELLADLKRSDRFVDQRRTSELGTRCRAWVFKDWRG